MENLPEKIIFECHEMIATCIADDIENIDEFINHNIEMIKGIIDKHQSTERMGIYVIKYLDDYFGLSYYSHTDIMKMDEEELGEIFSKWNHIFIKMDDKIFLKPEHMNFGRICIKEVEV